MVSSGLVELFFRSLFSIRILLFQWRKVGNMKITEVRTRVAEWRGETVPPQPHTCTNPVDLLDLPSDALRSFRFHSWLLVEIMTDSGQVGIGEAALAPRVTKQVIDLYLKPILIGQNPFDSEYLWQHMYRSTLAFGRKGIGMVAISAVDIGIWDLLGKIQNQPFFRLLGGKTKPKIPVYASRLYGQPLPELAGEARKYKEQGFRVLEKYQLRWVEEPVIPDDIGGYAALKAMHCVPIAGGEHEFTLYGFRELLDAKAKDGYIRLPDDGAHIVQSEQGRIAGGHDNHLVAQPASRALFAAGDVK